VRVGKFRLPLFDGHEAGVASANGFGLAQDGFALAKAEYLRGGADPSNLRYGYVLKG